MLYFYFLGKGITFFFSCFMKTTFKIFSSVCSIFIKKPSLHWYFKSCFRNWFIHCRIPKLFCDIRCIASTNFLSFQFFMIKIYLSLVTQSWRLFSPKKDPLITQSAFTCSKLTIEILAMPSVVLVPLLLTLNLFHTLF